MRELALHPAQGRVESATWPGALDRRQAKVAAAQAPRRRWSFQQGDPGPVPPGESSPSPGGGSQASAQEHHEPLRPLLDCAELPQEVPPFPVQAAAWLRPPVTAAWTLCTGRGPSGHCDLWYVPLRKGYRAIGMGPGGSSRDGPRFSCRSRFQVDLAYCGTG